MQDQAAALRIKIEFAQASDPGRDPNKQVNEDSCGYAQTRFGHLCVLCDGMGGHYGGKEASRTAITTIFEMFEQAPPHMTPAATLKASIEEAGRRVYRLGGPVENRTRPGSTVVAMLLHDKGLDVAHVGDSRAYIIRSNQIYPLTRDHSMVQGMIDAGMLTEESAMGHPDSNKITRALGMKPEVDVEVRPEVMELFPGDVLLQSSDGLTDLALGAEILGATRQALASGGVPHACNMLVKMANDRGGHDNITVQMVRVGEVAPKAGRTIPERPAEPVVLANGSQANPNQAAWMASGPAPSMPHGAGPVPRTTPDPVPMAGAPGQRPMTYGGQAPQAGAPGQRPITFGAAPTLNETPHPQQAQQQQGWGQPGYGPPSGAVGFGAPPGMQPPMGAQPSGQGLAPAGFAPAPAAGFAAPPAAAKGGIVFIIIGLSAVIAVLILVIIWAVVLR